VDRKSSRLSRSSVTKQKIIKSMLLFPQTTKNTLESTKLLSSILLAILSLYDKANSEINTVNVGKSTNTPAELFRDWFTFVTTAEEHMQFPNSSETAYPETQRYRNHDDVPGHHTSTSCSGGRLRQNNRTLPFLLL
jgi:hypothetical protein